LYEESIARIRKYKPTQDVAPLRLKTMETESEKAVREFEAKGIAD
jgi:hypothetical protein